MNEHQRCIELAAASIDFRLSADEQHALRTHLAICDSCSVTVRGLRDDATRLAAAPHPAASATVRRAVIGAAARRSGRTSGLRWAVLATMLAAVLVAGSFVAGSVVDRLRGPQVPAPTLPTTVQRSTPAPTDEQAPRPTGTPAAGTGWHDLGDVSDAFGGRTVTSVMARPGGGLVAFGQERTAAAVVVWVSDDGERWTEVRQQADVFANDVPASGALGGSGMLVIGSSTSVTGSQRAIWESSDGRVWSESRDDSALLGTSATDLTMTAGPVGIIVWRPSGQVWVSTDGATWKKRDVGVQGITDMAVDADGFVAVGQAGSDAFMVTSADGLTWAAPRREPAPAGTKVGIERSDDGVEAVWIGDQRWQRSGDSWSAVSGATVPVQAPGSIVAGQADLLAMASPTSAGAYRAWTWDGSGDWASLRQPAEPGTAAPTVVAVAPYANGWFVLTKRGSALHGWFVEP